MTARLVVDDSDEARALDSLGVQWDDIYYLGTCGDGYRATRRQGRPKTVTASTPGELSRAILADWTSR